MTIYTPYTLHAGTCMRCRHHIPTPNSVLGCQCDGFQHNISQCSFLGICVPQCRGLMMAGTRVINSAQHGDDKPRNFALDMTRSYMYAGVTAT